ncbi:hypothetical protein Tco_1497713 [Tanacetum coccineum]
MAGVTMDGGKKSMVEKILVDDAASLEKEFLEEEIVDAIRICEGGDKTPGPNGFNFKYIRKFLERIKSDLVLAVKWFGKQ